MTPVRASAGLAAGVALRERFGATG